jgi:hypothetical protein
MLAHHKNMGCVNNGSCAQFIVTESVFYFGQINNAGILNIRIASSDILDSSKCYVYSQSPSMVVKIVSLKLFYRNFQSSHRICHGPKFGSQS